MANEKNITLLMVSNVAQGEGKVVEAGEDAIEVELTISAYKWLNLDALAHLLLPHDSIETIKYFTARVSARPYNGFAHKVRDIARSASA